MTRQPYHLLIFCFLGVLLLSSCRDEEVLFFPHKRVLQLGDNMAWADPAYDDSSWDMRGATTEIGTFWVRFHVNFDDRIQEVNHKGLHMISLGSYEAYWDGVLIHENGKFGKNKEEELAGQFISQALVPDSLCGIGSHVLALRISNFQNQPDKDWSWNTLMVEEYLNTARKDLQFTALMFILGGCFLFVSLYYLLLFIKEKRDDTTLVFSIICFLFFVLLITEYLKLLWPYPYSFQSTRLMIIGCLTAVIAFVVPWFLCLHLSIPKRRYVLGLLIATITIMILIEHPSNDFTAMLLSSIMLGVSVGLSAFGVWLKRKGSVLLLCSFILVVYINYFPDFGINFMLYDYDVSLFLSFLILVLSILYSLSQQRKEQRDALEASNLLSERLKNELLKKNIQPHFIMNTLTSIMEWVERSPQKSIEFIEALAGEFELLNEMADEQLVPIKQEIDLCKKHLEIMTFRKSVAYEWEAEHIDFEQKVPPAVFHTIVENGITHSKSVNDEPIKFKLSQESINDGIVYALEVFAENRNKRSNKSTGTGFKYIRSRLTENYGDKWSLTSGETKTGWRTEIKIFK